MTPNRDHIHEVTTRKSRTPGSVIGAVREISEPGAGTGAGAGVGAAVPGQGGADRKSVV